MKNEKHGDAKVMVGWRLREALGIDMEGDCRLLLPLIAEVAAVSPGHAKRLEQLSAGLVRLAEELVEGGAR